MGRGRGKRFKKSKHNKFNSHDKGGTMADSTKSFGSFGDGPEPVITHAPGASPGSGSSKAWRRCYEDHPALKIPVGDKEYLIYGGSCTNPAVEDADVYVGLDMGMKQMKQMYPWHEGTAFLFPISDMQPPRDSEEFIKLIEWLAMTLEAGKKVHVGCLGGHGRTGTLFAALVKHMTGKEDAITYVRENYCEKAVESESQVKFLHEKFGIEKAKGAKTGYFSTPTTGKQQFVAPVKTYGEKGKVHDSGWSPDDWRKKKYQAPANQTSLWPQNVVEAAINTGMSMLGMGSSPTTTGGYNPANAQYFNSTVHKELEDVRPVRVRGSIWGDDTEDLEVGAVY